MPHVDFSRTFSPIFACLTGFSWIKVTRLARVADVKVPQYRRYPKGQRLLQKEGPPTYAILSQNLVLSRFTRFMNGHHRASTKVILLWEGPTFHRGTSKLTVTVTITVTVIVTGVRWTFQELTKFQRIFFLN